MTEYELRIAKIASLLNSAIREKNSKAYQKALSMLQQFNPKPSLQEILEAQAKETVQYKALEQAKQQAKLESLCSEGQNRENPEQPTLKDLENELEALRKQDPIPGSHEKTQEEIEQDEENRIQEVIRRYEKTFGRIKDLNSHKSSPGSAAGKSIVSSRPSKLSRASELSTASQREAFEKLKKLEEEEEKIRKEKEDLLKFLELRSSYSKTSSRPVTVGSIVSRESFGKSPEKSVPAQKLEPIEEKFEKPKKIVKTVKPKDEVEELLKNLY